MIWLTVVPFAAFAQSSSVNYQAVDFLNTSSSLGTSSNYAAGGSLDYYGGVAKSAGFIECTGDFAVMQGCGNLPIVVPPNPPPNVIGGGGGGGGSGSVNWPPEIEEPEVPVLPEQPEVPEEPEEPVLPEVPVEKPEIPVEVVEPSVPVRPQPRPITVSPPEEIRPSAPEIVEPEKGELPVVVIKPAEQVIVQVKKWLCEEGICADSEGVEESELYGAASSAACSVYVFGGFRVGVACDWYKSAALIGVALVSVFGINSYFIFRRRRRG